MSAAATWPTRAPPPAFAAGAVAYTLGLFCIILAALSLASGGAGWNLPALACLPLTACIAALRLVRARRRAAPALAWDDDAACFRLQGVDGPLELEQVWRGPAWVTLSLRTQSPASRVLRIAVWKSAIPAPLWCELALRIQAGGQPGGTAIRTRKTHEPA